MWYVYKNKLVGLGKIIQSNQLGLLFLSKIYYFLTNFNVALLPSL